MLAAQIKALSLLLGGTAVAGTAAYVSGALDRFIDAPVQQAAVQQPQAAPLMARQDPSAVVPQPATKPPVVEQPTTVQPPAAKAETANKAVVAPSFDIVRAEPDGSLVIAGKAAAGSTVEIVAGSKVLGTATASAEGDFAVVLDDPLPPGDYQIVLRATGKDNIVATSIETAIVSIPDRKDGQVLALVEQPGQPSRLITLPEATDPPATRPVAPASVNGQPSAETQPPAEVAAPLAVKQTATPALPPAKVLVKAVEIEGNRVFVAGTAPADSTVRVFANDILLGEAKASPNGDFLVETIRNLAVGDYIVRADLIAKNGRDVTTRAQVPFRRLEGEAVAAVAPGVVAPAQRGGEASAQTVKPEGASPVTTSDAAHIAAEPLEAAANGVIIRRGDTLWRISKRVYGRGVRYSTIYLANQEQISDPNRIWPGQVFSVPGKTNEGENADMDAIADQKAPKS